MSDATRRTARTVLADVIAVAAVLPLLVAELDNAGIDVTRLWPWLATIVAVAAAVTRVMAAPAVDDALTRVGLGKAAQGDQAPPDRVGE